MIDGAEADTPHDRAVLFYDRGIAYKNEKQFDRALADYSEAIKLDPKHAHAYLNRALVYASTGDSARAIADSSAAIKLDPTNMLPYLTRGLAYRSQRNFDAAIADLTKAISIASADPTLYLTRGFTYYSKGDLDRAIGDYGETLKRDPRSSAAYDDRGLAFAHKGDFDRAIADLTQAIEINPKSAGAYFNRGVGYYLTGQLPKALADLTEANALDPTQPYVALALDIVAVRSGLPSALKEASAKIDMTTWPAPLIRLYLGQLTPEATLAAADNPNAETQRGQVCEANFYEGVLDVRAGQKADAARRFNSAAKDCPDAYLEKMFAGFELKALGGSVSKP
jgi:lipoprotein NlpI